MAGQLEGSPASSDEDEQRAKLLLQQAKDEQLFVAVRRKCPQTQIIQAIQECLSNGANISAVNTRGKTILDISIQKKYDDVVRFLSEQDGKAKLDLDNSSNSDSYAQEQNESTTNFIQQVEPTTSVNVVDKKEGELNALLPVDGKRYMTEDKIKALNKILKSGLDTSAVMYKLIQHEIDINYQEPITNQCAIDIAWEYEYYDAMLLLLEAGSQFPKTLTLSALYENKDIPDKLITFVQERQQLHEWIKNNKIDEIQKFFTNLSSFELSTFFNIDNKSALEIAAEYANAKTIAFLISIKFPLQGRQQITISEEQRKLLRQLDTKGNTLLSIAAKSGKLDNVDLFIRCGIDINYCNRFKKRAIDLAWDYRRYDIVLALLEADSDFPNHFNLHGLNEENNQKKLKLFVQERNKLHKLIKENCFKEIKILTALYESKLCLNRYGQSALFTAFTSKRFDIYAYLKTIGLVFKNEEEEEHIIKLNMKLEVAEKDTLKLAMIREFPQVSKGHILYLISKTRSQKPVDSLKHIDKFYQYLDHIPEVSIILQVLQYTDYLDIVLDFDHENIMHINPTASETTRGTTDFKEGRIYVAAKCEERQLSGTLAHELTHQAMYMIYKNDCNPYNKEINDQSQTFDKITAEIKKRLKKVIENLHPDEDNPMATLATSFKYPEDEQQSEVIARVSHILAQYPHMGRDFLTKTFRSLNDYYNDVLDQCREFIKNSFLIKPRNSMQFLNETLGQINCIRQYKIHFKEPINLDDFLESKQQVFLVETESTFLAHLSIYESLVKRKKSHSLQDSLFLEFDTYIQNEDEILKLFYSQIGKILCLCFSTETNQKTLLCKLNELNKLFKYKPDKKVLLIIQEREKVVHNTVTDIFKNNYKLLKGNTFTLNDFTEHTQQMLLERQIMFQGENTFLNKFIDIADYNDKLTVDIITLVKLIKGEILEIGRRPLNVSNLEGAYSELFEDVNMETFIHQLLSQDSKDVYIISEVSSVEGLVNFVSGAIADTTERSKVINKLRNTLQVLNQHTYGTLSSDLNILVTDEQFDESDFMKLCYIIFDRKIYWICLRNEVKTSKFVLQQSYNPEFYITGKRFNHEVVIDKEVVKELCSAKLSDAFIIRVKYETQIIRWFHLDEEQFLRFESNRKKNNILFVTFQGAWEDWLHTHARTFVNKTIHLLEFVEDQLSWYKSYGSIDILHKYRAKEYRNIQPLMDETDFIKKIRNRKVTIIAGQPGSGKTTSLTQLFEANFREQFSPEEPLMKSHWVIKINLKDNIEAIRNINICNRDMDDGIITGRVTEFLLRADKKLAGNLTKTFAQRLLGIQLRKDHSEKPLYIMFDGFDEILDEANRNNIISLLRYLKEETNTRFCVTTRLHYEQNLETALSSFSIRLEPMDHVSVYKFISQYFNNRFQPLLNPKKFQEIFDHNGNGMMKYSDAFLLKMQEIFNADVATFIGTPLQLYILLEVSAGYFRIWTEESDHTKTPDFSYLGHDIWDVYEKFVYRKYDIVCKKTGLKEQKQLLKDKKYFDSFHMDLAKTLFNVKSSVKKSFYAHQDIILSAGIVKSDGTNHNFIHSTFAEFFAAKVFIHWMRKWKDNNVSEHKQTYLFSKILQLPDHRFIRAFLNAKLLNEKFELAQLEKYTVLKEDILYTATIENHVGIVEFVFDNFLNGNVEYFSKDIPILHNATDFKSFDVIKWLLEKGADVNQRNNVDETVSHRFASEGNLEMSKMLIEKGADIHAKDVFDRNILHKAVISRNIDIVRYLVDRGSALNDKDKDDQTALHIAAKFDDSRVVQCLVENGAKINAKDNDYNTPLLEAVQCYGNMEVIKWLAENGADIHSKNKNGQTVLHLAGHITNIMLKDKLKLLVGKGANINARDQDNRTVLHYIVDKPENLGEVKWLVEKGADINAKDKNGQSVLHRAALSENAETIQWLVNNGADVNAVNENNQNILHLAGKIHSEEILEFLFKKGADINAKDKHNHTVLHYAVECWPRTLNVVKWLVEKGADFNAADKDGQSILHVAVKTGDINIVKFLVEKGADINVIDQNGRTVLHSALDDDTDDHILRLDNNKVKTVKWLVIKGADFNTKGTNSSTAFHYAITEFEIVKWLVEKGADINAKDENDCPILHEDVILGHLKIVKWLVENGANVSAKDEQELRYAAGPSTIEVIKWLCLKGADINAVDGRGRTALHLAAHLGHFKTVKWLVRSGADINARDNTNRTILHYAAPNFKNLQVISWLLEQGADVNAKDHDGRTVLHYYFEHLIQLDEAQSVLKKTPNLYCLKESPSFFLSPYKVTKLENLEIVKWLVEKSVDLNAKNMDDQGVLQGIDLFGNLKVVLEYLHVSNIYFNTKDTFNIRKVTEKATETDDLFYIEIIKWLVRKGADINIRNNNGYTLLLNAISKHGKLKTVERRIKKYIYRLLVVFGYSEHLGLNLDQSLGVKFFDALYNSLCSQSLVVNHIRKKRDLELVELPVGKYNIRPSFHPAVGKLGHLETMAWLEKDGADISTNEGQTALHVAAKTENTDIVRWLVEKRADMRANNNPRARLPKDLVNIPELQGDINDIFLFSNKKITTLMATVTFTLSCTCVVVISILVYLTIYTYSD